MVKRNLEISLSEEEVSFRHIFESVQSSGRPCDAGTDRSITMARKVAKINQFSDFYRRVAC